MKHNKVARWLESIVYFILLTIPLISVFARTIYVQSNHEAYRSYSDNTEYIQSENIYSDTNYLFNSSSLSYQSFDSGVVYYQDVTNVRTNDTNLYNALLDTSYTNFRVFASTTNKIIYFYKADNSSSSFSLITNSVSFNFNLISFNPNNVIQLKVLLYITQSNTLDNAFDYGIQKTIDDFGQGNINFLNWFGTLFFNDTNLLYIQFVNMYLNYSLWVSLGYLMYYFLNWFIRFIRNLLDSFIYKEGNSK